MKKIIGPFLFSLVFLNTHAQTWEPLGTGLNANSGALTTYNGELYAGGAFTTAGGIPADRIAKWNGTSWSTVGTGMNGGVGGELVVYNGELYAGGTFTTAGGIPANNIAKWNGATWSALGSGVNGTVNASAILNGELYIGGAFTTAGGITVNRVAKWNGTAWSAVGTGMNNTVNTLVIFNGELYAGGLFTIAGSNPANRVAKWNGTSWSSVGLGFNNFVSALGVYNGELYAGGIFTAAEGNPASRIAKWNGTSWSALGTGLNNFVREFLVYDGELIVAGGFTLADGITANRVAKWNGTNWSAMGLGLNAQVVCLAVYNGFLYANGEFTLSGGVVVNRIAKWIPPCLITSSAGADENLIYGYGPVQCKTKTAVVSNGTPPYTYSWTLDRPLLPGESITGAATVSVTVCLLDTAQLNLTVTDARNCIAADAAMFFVNDVRCFAGNNQKVLICHKGNTLCVDESAVSAHLRHSDYLGSCAEAITKKVVIKIEENSRDGAIIYPNPATNQIIIQNYNNKMIGAISIYNLSGQMIYKKFIGSSQTKIDVKNFPPGVYYIISDQTHAAVKFVKQ